MGTLPSTQNTFSMLFDSVCAVKALITNCDKSQIATAGIPELSQFVTVAICDGSKHNCSDRFHSDRGCTPKCRKQKSAKIQLFIFMSKLNLGTLPSTQNTFSVLLDSVCAVTAMITKCDKSQNATARIPELSQFVTVAFCDGSKCNFSDSCPLCKRVYSSV